MYTKVAKEEAPDEGEAGLEEVSHEEVTFIGYIDEEGAIEESDSCYQCEQSLTSSCYQMDFEKECEDGGSF